jgi:hypothetical protein
MRTVKIKSASWHARLHGWYFLGYRPKALSVYIVVLLLEVAMLPLLCVFCAAPFLFYSVRTRIFPKSSSEYGNVITECAVLAIAASVLFYFALAWISVGVYLEIAAFHLIGYSSPTVIGLVNEKFLLPGGIAGWALNAVGTVFVIWRMRRPAIEWVD